MNLVYDYSNKREKQSVGSRRRNILLEKRTAAELIFEEKLKLLHIKYIPQKLFISGKNMVITDFYIPKPHKLCIEIDGEYHLLPEQIKRDKNRTDYLNKRNFKVARITNDKAFSMSVDDVYDLIYSKKR